ncbi:hypothetical protein [Streptomyces sp. NBC_01233]|uniref:hypothetical protein n=1 Tax=Streptomyces sp. NBC_01233 TaxID=2903787 RepID=UPI002E121DBF|nr:hypothetical protein OG332_01145 [Streptomyces sp. NBC_01233]
MGEAVGAQGVRQQYGRFDGQCLPYVRVEVLRRPGDDEGLDVEQQVLQGEQGVSAAFPHATSTFVEDVGHQLPQRFQRGHPLRHLRERRQAVHRNLPHSACARVFVGPVLDGWTLVFGDTSQDAHRIGAAEDGEEAWRTSYAPGASTSAAGSEPRTGTG